MQVGSAQRMSSIRATRRPWAAGEVANRLPARLNGSSRRSDRGRYARPAPPPAGAHRCLASRSRGGNRLVVDGAPAAIRTRVRRRDRLHRERAARTTTAADLELTRARARRTTCSNTCSARGRADRRLALHGAAAGRRRQCRRAPPRWSGAVAEPTTRASTRSKRRPVQHPVHAARGANQTGASGEPRSSESDRLLREEARVLPPRHPGHHQRVAEVKDWLDGHGTFRHPNAAIFFPRLSIADP